MKIFFKRLSEETSLQLVRPPRPCQRRHHHHQQPRQACLRPRRARRLRRSPRQTLHRQCRPRLSAVANHPLNNLRHTKFKKIFTTQSNTMTATTMMTTCLSPWSRLLRPRISGSRRAPWEPQNPSPRQVLCAKRLLTVGTMSTSSLTSLPRSPLSLHPSLSIRPHWTTGPTLVSR